MKRFGKALLVSFAVSCIIPLVLARVFSGEWPDSRGVRYVFGMASVTVLAPLALVAAPVLYWLRSRGLRQTLGEMTIGAVATGVLGCAMYVWLWTGPNSDPLWNTLRALASPEALLMYPLFGIPGALYGYFSRDRPGAIQA